MKSKSDKNQSKLPWWVELLFVQIGLPDSWLSKYLKKKKEAANFIDENKKNIVYSAIIIAGILFLLDNLDFMNISIRHLIRTYWPVILIWIGAEKLYTCNN